MNIVWIGATESSLRDIFTVVMNTTRFARISFPFCQPIDAAQCSVMTADGAHRAINYYGAYIYTHAYDDSRQLLFVVEAATQYKFCKQNILPYRNDFGDSSWQWFFYSN